MEDWQLDWHRFADVLQDAIHAGEDSRTISKRFEGKVVQWRGVLVEPDPEGYDPEFVDIKLAERIIELGGGNRTVIGPQTLKIAKGSSEEWRKISVGTEVGFSARFGIADSPFPCVGVHRYSKGKGMVSTSLVDARPIDCLK